jgi:hypothetical protein
VSFYLLGIGYGVGHHRECMNSARWSRLLSTSQRNSAVLDLSSVLGQHAFNPLVMISCIGAGRRLSVFGFQIAKRCTAFKESLTMRDVSTPASLTPKNASV